MKASDGTQDPSESYTNSPSTTPKERIAEALKNICIYTANQYGGFEGFEPDDLEKIEEATHALLELMIDERIDELERLKNNHDIFETDADERIQQLKSERKNTE